MFNRSYNSNRISYNGSNEDVEDKLLEQLHEQYAINNNANLGSVVTILVSLIAVLGVFGYIFVRSTLDFSKENDFLYNRSVELYTMDVFVLAGISSIVVLTIIDYLYLFQGYNQRYEQFIIYAIRQKFFSKDSQKIIFPDAYNPFNKNSIEAVQGVFGEICKMTRVLSFIVCCAVAAKSVLSCLDGEFGTTGIVMSSLFILTLAYCRLFICVKDGCLYDKYLSRWNEYERKYNGGTSHHIEQKCRNCPKFNRSSCYLYNIVMSILMILSPCVKCYSE